MNDSWWYRLHPQSAEIMVAGDLDGEPLAVPPVPKNAKNVAEALPNGLSSSGNALPVMESSSLPK
jgi:hypothetical protein